MHDMRLSDVAAVSLVSLVEHVVPLIDVDGA
jgi:hypothetical protein